MTVGEGAMLDHETTASYTVTVTAMDTGRLYGHDHGDHHGR